MAFSTVPAALAALVSAWQDGLPIKVLDGPTMTTSTANEWAVVGYEDEDSPDVVEATSDPEGLGSELESYTVRCAITVQRGKNQLTQARLRAYELLEAAQAALSADKTLGGAVMACHVATHSLRQMQTNEGAVVQVPFGVYVQAYVRP